MSGNTVGTAVTLAIGENGSKIAYFSHSACTVREQRTLRPLNRPPNTTTLRSSPRGGLVVGGGGLQ